MSRQANREAINLNFNHWAMAFGVADGHVGDLLLARELRPPNRLEAGTTVTLTADVDWLVCNRSSKQLNGAGMDEPRLSVRG